jgi:hypothetical protein
LTWAALWRSAYWTAEVRRHQFIQVLVGRLPDELGEVLFLATLVDLWFGKGDVTTRTPCPDRIPPAHLTRPPRIGFMASTLNVGTNLPLGRRGLVKYNYKKET